MTGSIRMAPASAPMFVLMQLLGGALGLAAVLLLYPRVHELADDLAHLDQAQRHGTDGTDHPTTGAPA